MMTSYSGAQYEEGEFAYNTYSDEVHGLNYRGEPMPEWWELPEGIQRAWIETAGRTIARFTEKDDE